MLHNSKTASMDVETGHRVHKPPTKMHPFVLPFYHQVKNEGIHQDCHV